MEKLFKVTKKYKDDILSKALVRGFKNRIKFTSATGMQSAYIKGTLLVKENYTDPEEFKFNGDVVSTSGWGLVYSRKDNKWGEIEAVL